MFTIDVIREAKAIESRVKVADPLDIATQNNLLQRSISSWTQLSPSLHRVPGNAENDDFSDRTSLGTGDSFVLPFREGLENYATLYGNGNWCYSVDEDIPLQKYISPFENSLGRDPSFAQKLRVGNDSRVILIGDIHSSFHSFVHIVDNLVQREILGDDLSLSPKFYIIFLGDIFDRGPYALDILNIIFQIKNKTFDRVILLNGNHEDFRTYNNKLGTGMEIVKQLNNTTNQKLVHSLMRRLPSVLFLEMNDQTIQCCHGGVEPEYDPKRFLDSSFTFHFHGYDTKYVLKYMGLRWTDFSARISGSELSPGRGQLYGVDATNSYLARNGLAGIIRGHQDFHHLSLLPRIPLKKDAFYDRYTSWSPTYELYTLTSDYPKQTSHYPKNATCCGSFHRQPLHDVFGVFSVVTTSTAMRARPSIGLNTYLELKTHEENIHNAQANLAQVLEDRDNRQNLEDLFGEQNLVSLRFYLGEGSDSIPEKDYHHVKELYRALCEDQEPLTHIAKSSSVLDTLFCLYELLRAEPFKAQTPPPQNGIFNKFWRLLKN